MQIVALWPLGAPSETVLAVITHVRPQIGPETLFP